MSLKHLFTTDVEETPIAEEVTISGYLPKWLRGTYYKAGQAKYTLPGGFQMNHLFDGYAIMYEYVIEDNKVRFRSKYLDSDAYKQAMEFGKPTHAEFGTRQYPNPNKNAVSRAIANFFPVDLTDNNCGNLFTYRDKVYACNDSYFLHEIDPVSLQSAAKVDLRNSGLQTSAAHCLRDESGALYNTGLSFKGGMLKQVIVEFSAPSPNDPDVSGATFDPNKYSKIIATVTPKSKTNITYTHSFGMSENYFLLIEQPLKLNFFSFAAGQLKGKTIMECIHWNPDDKAKFIVIERSSGDIVKRKFHALPFCFIHIINMYEENEHLIIDVIAYNNNECIKNLTMSNLRNDECSVDESPGTLKRFVLPITKTEKIKENENLVTLSYTKASAIKIDSRHIFSTPEVLFDIPMDIVRMNESCIGKKYRFIYTFDVFYNHEFRNHLLKLDLETREVKTWKSNNETYFPTEPLFIPNPEGKDEDDGIVVAVIVEGGKKNSVLIFLDAKSFTEIARAEFACQANLGNHGLFVFKKESDMAVKL